MKDIKAPEIAGIFETESGRYYINGSNTIMSRTKVAWEDVFDALAKAEEEWRQWLLMGFLTPFSEHADDPLSMYRLSSADQTSELTFKVNTNYGTQKKYRFIQRKFIFYEWMNRLGLVPTARKAGQPKKPMRFPRGFKVEEVLDSLGDVETKLMWESILIDKDTRIPLNSGLLDANLEYDFDHIRELAEEKSNSITAMQFLNFLFEQALGSEASALSLTLPTCFREFHRACPARDVPG